MTNYIARVGQDGATFYADNLQHIVEFFNDCLVGHVARWTTGGFDTCNYWHMDCVAIMAGDEDDGFALRTLNEAERDFIQNALTHVER